MSFLTFPLTVPDTYVMTASFWFKVEATDGDFTTLMEFGNPTGAQLASAISCNFQSAGDIVDVYLVSGDAAITVQILGQFPGSAPGQTVVLNRSSGLQTLRNKWVHVFCSCDLSVMENFDYPPTPGSPYYLPKIRLYTDGTDAVSSYPTMSATPGGYLVPGGTTNMVIPVPLPSNYQIISPWKIAINGFDFGIPSQSEYVQPNVQYAAVQVWFDQYIDPTPTNLSKFINVETGELVRPEVAQEYFGRGQIVFDGGKDFFHLNQVGGTTTLYGEGEDVDPYPIGLDVPVA